MVSRDIPLHSEGQVEIYVIHPALAKALRAAPRHEPAPRLAPLAYPGPFSAGANDLVFSGVDVMARLMAEPGTLNGLYIEYANSASLPIPVINPSEGVAYYTGLDGTTRDYLRVPARPDGTLEASDSRYTGNRIRFIGVSGGERGVKGLPFGSAAGSAVVGAALVMLGKPPADDLVYARYYATAAEPLSDNQAIGVSWTLTLKHPQHAA
jgi:hypothetical protein